MLELNYILIRLSDTDKTQQDCELNIKTYYRF